jgi:galactose mutarotase-like enzyme
VSHESDSWVKVRSAALSAEINPLGAQLSILRDRDARDLLWNGEAAVWASRAPILFPIVGSLAGGRYRLGHRSFALSRHGFARGKLFEVVATTPSSATFRLRADDSTLAVYPFPFELDVSYVLASSTLSVTALVRNTGNEPMPASLGFHPGLRWPLPYGATRGEHFIEFEADEPAPIRRINAEGLLTPEGFATPVVNRRLMLSDELFRDDVLILDRLNSRSVRYGSAHGPQIELRFPDAQYLGIWTKPGAPFLCIEPWQGITDPAGFADDFTRKPGVFTVAPRASSNSTRSRTTDSSSLGFGTFGVATAHPIGAIFRKESLVSAFTSAPTASPCSFR